MQLKSWDTTIIRYAWTFIVKNLYKYLSKCEGFPIKEWPPEEQRWAIQWLHYVGRGVLIKRIAVQHAIGLVDIEKTDKKWDINVVQGVENQFLDNYDHVFLKKIERAHLSIKESIFDKWNHSVNSDLDELLSKYDNVFITNTDKPIPYDTDRICTLIKNGIQQYPVGFGNLIRYHAEDEVVVYILSIAVNMAKRWMRDAGIDVESSYNNIKFLDILIVVSIITAMNLRHSIYLNHSFDRKDIDIPCSMTIWSSRDNIVDEVNLILKMDKDIICNILDIVSLNNGTYKTISDNENFYMPPLIEIGKNIYIRPISSLVTNPFFMIRKYIHDTDKKEYSKIISNRENLFREDIYNMFRGNRFRLTQSNIKIKDLNGNIITDIDAAIFDVLDNSLALFQLKWQDFDTNDTLSLRSKSKNLVKEIDNWGIKLDSWLKSIDVDSVKRTFRIKSKSKQIIVYLFVITRGFSRVESFGFSSEVPALAIANYFYFQRIRGEIGPRQQVFPLMHKKFKQAREELSLLKPKPMSFSVNDSIFSLERYWFGLPDELQAN